MIIFFKERKEILENFLPEEHKLSTNEMSELVDLVEDRCKDCIKNLVKCAEDFKKRPRSPRSSLSTSLHKCYCELCLIDYLTLSKTEESSSPTPNTDIKYRCSSPLTFEDLKITYLIIHPPPKIRRAPFYASASSYAPSYGKLSSKGESLS